MQSGRHIGILRRKMNCGYERRIHIRSFCFSDRKRLNNISIYDFSEITRDSSINTKGKREPRVGGVCREKDALPFPQKKPRDRSQCFLSRGPLKLCQPLSSPVFDASSLAFITGGDGPFFFCNPTFSSRREAPPPFCRSNGRTYSGTPRRCPYCP